MDCCGASFPHWALLTIQEGACEGVSALTPGGALLDPTVNKQKENRTDLNLSCYFWI